VRFGSNGQNRRGRRKLTDERDSGEGSQVVNGGELLVVSGMIGGADEVKKRTANP
jgi:hypothetical protein